MILGHSNNGMALVSSSYKINSFNYRSSFHNNSSYGLILKSSYFDGDYSNGKFWRLICAGYNNWDGIAITNGSSWFSSGIHSSNNNGHGIAITNSSAIFYTNTYTEFNRSFLQYNGGSGLYCVSSTVNLSFTEGSYNTGNGYTCISSTIKADSTKTTYLVIGAGNTGHGLYCNGTDIDCIRMYFRDNGGTGLSCIKDNNIYIKTGSSFNNDGHGVYSESHNNIRLDYFSSRDNDYDGIYCGTTTSLILINDDIYNNNHGIFIAKESSLVTYGCSIHDNSNNGISGYQNCRIVIENSNIKDNGDWGLDLYKTCILRLNNPDSNYYVTGNTSGSLKVLGGTTAIINTANSISGFNIGTNTTPAYGNSNQGVYILYN
jgi:hypothetical protein